MQMKNPEIKVWHVCQDILDNYTEVWVVCVRHLLAPSQLLMQTACDPEISPLLPTICAMSAGEEAKGVLESKSSLFNY